MVEYFFCSGKKFQQHISKEKYFNMKAQILLSSPTTNHNNWQKVNVEKKSHMKKKENQKAFVRDARRPWMKAK